MYAYFTAAACLAAAVYNWEVGSFEVCEKIIKVAGTVSGIWVLSVC